MRRWSALLLLAALTAASAPPAGAQATGGQADPGFRVEVRGVTDAVDREAFLRGIQQALPGPLTDRAGNFTRDDAWDADTDYRLVMIFHGDDAVEAGSLCRAPLAEVAPDARPPAFTDLVGDTSVTAAFCAGQETLSTASERMSGEVTPEAASFRFLVADVTKQLFPSGFSVLPGTGPAARASATPP